MRHYSRCAVWGLQWHPEHHAGSRARVLCLVPGRSGPDGAYHPSPFRLSPVFSDAGKKGCFGTLFCSQCASPCRRYRAIGGDMLRHPGPRPAGPHARKTAGAAADGQGPGNPDRPGHQRRRTQPGRPGPRVWRIPAGRIAAGAGKPNIAAVAGAQEVRGSGFLAEAEHIQLVAVGIAKTAGVEGCRARPGTASGGARRRSFRAPRRLASNDPPHSPG